MPQRHLLNRPFHASKLHCFPNVELVFEQNKKSVDDVMHQRLRAKADRQARDSSTCQQRPKIQAEQRQSFETCNQQNDGRAQPVDNISEGLHLLTAQS